MCICILNWAAPATFTSAMQRVQAAVMGALVNMPGSQNIGAVLMPSYCYRKGSLYKQEELAAKSLANANLNMDQSFGMPFKGKNDERERRTGLMFQCTCLIRSRFCIKHVLYETLHSAHDSQCTS